MSRKRKQAAPEPELAPVMVVTPEADPRTVGHPAPEKEATGPDASTDTRLPGGALSAPPVVKRKRGGQTLFTEELAKEIVELVAEGTPLAQICRREDMPGLSTVYLWEKAHPEFAEAIARARVAGYDQIAQEALRIADDGFNDTYEDDDGHIKVSSDVIQRSKLRVETRLKLLAKWDPRRYGDKVQTEVTGPDGGPVKSEVTVTMTPVEAYLTLKNGGQA